ncbi:MAG: hypothetical protein ACREP3_13680 [Candidatus Binatia bacterium]
MIRVALFIFMLAALGCASTAQAPFAIQALGGKSLWIPTARNSTDADLRLPGANPLRSLGEIAGKTSPDYRPTVMDLLRTSVKREMGQRKAQARFPEEHDARLSVLPLGSAAAARIAREGGLDGSLFLSEIRRWEADTAGLLRLWVEFKLVRIADGVLLWERRIQKVFAAGRAGNPAEAHNDAVREITKELF